MTYALILAAHGSTDRSSANQPLFDVAEQIKSRSDFSTVTPAFLQGEPNIKNVLSEIREERVLVMRWMTGRGYYSDIVFPRHLNSNDNDERVDMLPIIGHDSRIANIVSARITFLLNQYAISDSETSVVVVGHGTRKNKKSCLSTIALVKRLRAMRSKLRIEFAFLDQRPGLKHVAERVTSKHKIVIPFFMGQGPHTLVDIPTAVGLPANENAVFPIVDRRDGLVICDRPLGNYPELVKIALDIQRSHLSNDQPNCEIQQRSNFTATLSPLTAAARTV